MLVLLPAVAPADDSQFRIVYAGRCPYRLLGCHDFRMSIGMDASGHSRMSLNYLPSCPDGSTVHRCADTKTNYSLLVTRNSVPDDQAQQPVPLGESAQTVPAQL